MRIATWNVNSLTARLSFVEHWLKAREPDVVCVQELKLTDEAFPHLALETLGYKAFVAGQLQWNGVAIFSRRGGTIVRRHLQGAEDDGARLITVDVDGIRFTSVYVPNGKTVTHPDYRRKLAWLDALGDLVEQEHKLDEPHVLAGDFNLCPGPLDTHDAEGLEGQIFHTGEERRRFQRIVDAGYVDLFRRQHPTEQRFSWWDYRAGAFHKNLGLRIDFVLGSKAIAERVTEATIDRDYRKKKDGLTASDHAPVIIDLRD